MTVDLHHRSVERRPSWPPFLCWYITFAFIPAQWRSEEHTSELQSQSNLVCRLLLEKKKKQDTHWSIRLVHRHGNLCDGFSRFEQYTVPVQQQFASVPFLLHDYLAPHQSLICRDFAI